MADLSGMRVLVVDDYEDTADAMAIMLRYEGALVRVEKNASHIVDVVREFEPALVLLDLGMPDIDGYEACRLIRATRGTKIYIAALSGWSSAEDRLSCQKAGFDIHLTKPVGMEAVVHLAHLAVLSGDGTKNSVPAPEA